MNKAEKKFRIYAIIVIFVLLTVLLTVINGVNFTMAADDADMLTEMLSERQGSFERGENAPGDFQYRPKDDGFRMGPMGPQSPEMNASLRYFTIAFTDSGEAETVAFNISAVTESEAREWARSLYREKTGWTKGTYRYRVYKKGGTTYVTVIDQGRELLPSYRILIISAIGEAAVLLTGWFVLLFIGRKIYAPIEEADRKQKNFIKNANMEFRVPLTVIYANTELAERKYGPDDQTRSTRRQLSKMNELVDRLGEISVFDGEPGQAAEFPFSEYLTRALDKKAAEFEAKGVSLTVNAAPGVTVRADRDAMEKLIDELICNALKFSLSKADFTLKNENGRVVLETENDADLPDGPADQVFDRFTTLENNKEKENGAGLGLPFVKQTVRAYNGRVSAEVKDGAFALRIVM